MDDDESILQARAHSDRFPVRTAHTANRRRRFPQASPASPDLCACRARGHRFEGQCLHLGIHLAPHGLAARRAHTFQNGRVPDTSPFPRSWPDLGAEAQAAESGTTHRAPEPRCIGTADKPPTRITAMLKTIVVADDEPMPAMEFIRGGYRSSPHHGVEAMEDPPRSRLGSGQMPRRAMAVAPGIPTRGIRDSS